MPVSCTGMCVCVSVHVPRRTLSTTHLVSIVSNVLSYMQSWDIKLKGVEVKTPTSARWNPSWKTCRHDWRTAMQVHGAPTVRYSMMAMYTWLYLNYEQNSFQPCFSNFRNWGRIHKNAVCTARTHFIGHKVINIYLTLCQKDLACDSCAYEQA